MNITKRYVDDVWHSTYQWLPVGSVIYVAQSDFSEKDQVKTAGFRWQPLKKTWWTNDINRAAKMSEFADPSCRDELEAVRKQNFQSLQDSRATTTELSFPHPESLDYRPFQRAGIKYALSRPGTLIGDEMGLGKTIQAIGVINSDESIKTVLVICPATLKLNWLTECKKWLTRPMKIAIGDGKTCPMPELGYNIVIINYDVCDRWGCLSSIVWDLIVLDECHRLSHHDIERTVAIYGGKSKAMKKKEKKEGITLPYKKEIKARIRLALTGTPICNRPNELYPTLAYLVPEWKTKWKYFMSRYCGYVQTRYGCDVSGASNLEELQEVLRISCMIRRLKSQVLTELPPKTRQIVLLDPDSASNSAIRRELEASKKAEATYERLKAQVELAKATNDTQYKDAVEALKSAMSADFAELSTLRHETALAKVPAVIDYLKERFEEVDKIVVFCHHKDVIAKICAAFPGESVHITGSDSLESRQQAVDSFQNNPKTKLFVGSITAAGVGITLTAASIVIFVELDWVPGNITQAEDRCHRIGQKDSVTVQHLLYDNSLDSKMAKTLIEKQEIIEKTLDLEPHDEPIGPSEKPSTANLNRQKIEEESLSITREEISNIHKKLRILAGMDGDYANTINGVGFNKIDTYIGHSLAEQTTLTARQAILGRRLVKKYHKQFGE